MFYRPVLLIAVLLIALGILSCNEKQTNLSSSIDTRSITSHRTDSVLNSITGNEKRILINPKKSNVVVSKKGITFSIPENSFVTIDGVVPEGKVSLRISEYHNPADILVSKIPMQYRTKTGAVQMESAGMFHISAKAGDTPLQLASNKKIGVDVPAKNTDADFNVYYFDLADSAWVKIEDNISVSNKKEDTQDVQAASTAVVAKEQMVQSEGMIVSWNTAEAVKRVVDGKVITLVRPDCSYKENDFSFPVLIDKYPELGLYKNAVWLGNTNKDENKVYAAFQNDELISAEILERETPLNKYLISFEFRHVKFNAYMKIASQNDMCEINDEIYFALYETRPVDEKKVEKIKTETKKVKKQNELVRSFSINQLGIWNCDRLYLLPQKTIINPRFRSLTTGDYCEPTTCYLIDKNIKSVWTFNNKITLNPESNNLIVFVNERGVLCYVRLDKSANLKKESTLNIILDVTECSDNPDNTDELNKLLMNG